MKQQLLVRSLLVDPMTKKYIKAVDEQNFSDFIQLLARKDGDSQLRVFDFSPVVEAVHRRIDEQLSFREDAEVNIKRKNVFNGWKRLVSLRNKDLRNSTVVQVCSEAEDALNWMHKRLPGLKSTFVCAREGYDYQASENKKSSTLFKFYGEVQAFIEVLLCSMHSTFLVDTEYFKKESVYINHCSAVRKLLVDALHRELNYSNGEFDWNSFIYQCVMEPQQIGINADALLLQVGSDMDRQSVERKLVGSERIRDFDDGSRGYVVRWQPMSSDKIESVKSLSQMLQEIDAIIIFLNDVRHENFQFESDGPGQDGFEQELRLLLDVRVGNLLR
ncbi:hypothetical protein [Pseudomonas sp. Pseusp16]|uniref:hypothetical protein n=1 Tax=Pseudomonas sp. Pseusp16 TaxID=3243021 RepID=UPI0039B6E640